MIISEPICIHKQVADVMQPEVVSVRIDTLANRAFEIMRKGGFRHLPVVNAEGCVIGIISDRDLRNVTILFEKRPRGPDDYMVIGPVDVGSVMTPGPVTVSPDDGIRQAAVLMTKGRFGCLPVLDGAELVGIVTETDLVRLLVTYLDGSRDQEEGRGTVTQGNPERSAGFHLRSLDSSTDPESLADAAEKAIADHQSHRLRRYTY